MAKITDYPELTLIDPETEYVVIAYNGFNYKVLAGNLTFPAPRNKMISATTDLLVGTTPQLTPWNGIATGGSTFAPIASVDNHPGIWQGNAGSRAGLVYGGSIRLFGGETVEAIFRSPSTVGNSVRIGFDDGSFLLIFCILQITTTTVSGQCGNGGVPVQTDTTFTITANTWYRAKIVLGANASTVTFYLFDMTGALLWSDDLSSSIPTGIDLAAVCVNLASNQIHIDWATYYNPTLLVR